MKSQALHTIVWKENKIFVAKFLELELASQGKTRKEALANLKEALELYLEDEPKSNISFPLIEDVSSQKILIN
ncbi:MAG: HicB family protein [Candidatus Levybacteria bacterium CG10_big_fil_rev_8_21_14_0_10_35_13]|nr:MAG: HicB family protein [Candidatus Levybacteria bacterium CG10_big_fil_rev_8_21_14_0_10_35_13]